MPQNKDLKRLVRARMAETGENYTQALTALLSETRLDALPDGWHMSGNRRAQYEAGLLPRSMAYDGRRVIRLRFGRSTGASEALVQAPAVQHGHDPAAHAVCAELRDLPCGALLQHNWPHPGQGKLTGEHQAVRAAADDHDIDHGEIPLLMDPRGALPCTGSRRPGR